MAEVKRRNCVPPPGGVLRVGNGGQVVLKDFRRAQRPIVHPDDVELAKYRGYRIVTSLCSSRSTPPAAVLS